MNEELMMARIETLMEMVASLTETVSELEERLHAVSYTHLRAHET